MKSRKAAGPAVRRRGWFWVAGTVLALALLPILQVAWVRFWNPSVTPLMLLRPIEARWSGKTAPDRQYVWLPLAEMPRAFLRCVITAEDQRFFQHHGFDWREVALARAQAERTGRQARGASTISMQCARSLFLWQGRSWIRKGLEAYYTFWMEALLPKRRILELYGNVIEIGDGIYGLEAAAQAHFQSSARGLSGERCAALAAILPNPRVWDPRQPSPKLQARIAKIVRQESRVVLPKNLGG